MSSTYNGKTMSFGKELRQQIEQQTKPSNEHQAAREIAEVLGIVARGAVDAVIEDMAAMIAHTYWKQLDGYVLALSKIMAHDLAWECVLKAFERQKATPPPKYQTLLAKQPVHKTVSE